VDGPSVFDMMEDLPTTNIDVEQVDMSVEPSCTDPAEEAGRDQTPSMDSEDYGLVVSVAKQDSDEEDSKVLLVGIGKVL
jgi:hypothetical protein